VTQTNRACVNWAARRSTVAPAPISMSSQCAPTSKITGERLWGLKAY
jgi:hypothetical protein